MAFSGVFRLFGPSPVLVPAGDPGTNTGDLVQALLSRLPIRYRLAADQCAGPTQRIARSHERHVGVQSSAKCNRRWR